MDTRLSPRQGPENPSISDQILPLSYYAVQSAVVSLSNAISIDLRGKKSIRVVVGEMQAGSMSGRLAFHFSSTAAGGFESVPSQEHIVTATAVTGDLVEYYRFDLHTGGAAFLRIPVTEAIVNGTVTVTYLFGD